MQRALLAIVATAIALAMLLSFKTHQLTTAAASPLAVAPGLAPAAASAPAPSTAPVPAAKAPVAPAATAAPPTPATGTPARTAVPQTTTPAPVRRPVVVPTTASTPRTVAGDPADTRYGPVQVEITVVGGKLTAVHAVEYPRREPRDAQINSYAIPVLDKEALAAGNAHIDMVSGATYTSAGYRTSLQSSLDKAGV